MREKHKRHRQLSQDDKSFLGLVDKYIDATGKTTVDLNDVVQWGRATGNLELPNVDINKILVNRLSLACRREHIEDENGEPVRRRHAYKIKEGEKQQTFWFRMEDGTPDEMKLSTQQRRKGIAGAVFQANRDVKFYNANYNPGDPIEPDWNFNKDIAEREQSDEYDDTPPTENEEE